jgi:hypothetical protein
MPLEIEAFTDFFIEAKQTQWAAFRKRLGENHVPVSFREIVASVDSFLSPIIRGLASGRPIFVNWIAPGPWA